MRKLRYIVGVLILLLTFLLLLNSTTSSVTATNNISYVKLNWTYCKVLYISNASNDYQLRLFIYREDGHDDPTNFTIDCDGYCRSDFGDIRFYSSNFTELPYWIEVKEGSEYAVFWVRLPSTIESEENPRIYMFYGNPTATSKSNPYDVWILFEDWSTDWTPEYEEKTGHELYNYITLKSHFRFSENLTVQHLDSVRYITKVKVKVWQRYDYWDHAPRAYQGVTCDNDSHIPTNGVYTFWFAKYNRWGIKVYVDGSTVENYTSIPIETDSWRKNEICISPSGVIATLYSSNYTDIIATVNLTTVPSSIYKYLYYGERYDYEGHNYWAYQSSEDSVSYGGYSPDDDGIVKLYTRYTCIGKYSYPEPTISKIEYDHIEYPANGSTNVELYPLCKIFVVKNSTNQFQKIEWYENSTGSWVLRQTDIITKTGVYVWRYKQAVQPNKTYYWKVKIGSEEYVYHFTTGWNLTNSESCTYLKKIYIENPVNNYQLRLVVYKEDGHDDLVNYTIDCDGNCNDNFSNIKFTNETSELPCWIEYVNYSNFAVFWIKLPSDIESQEEPCIYMYYGEGVERESQNPEEVFDYYINMSEDDPTDNPEWSFGGYYAYENGYLRLGKNSDNTNGRAYLDLTHSNVYGTTKTSLRVLIKHNPLGVHGQSEGRYDDVHAWIDGDNYHGVEWGNYGSPRFRFAKEVDGSREMFSTDSVSLPYDDKDRWWLLKINNSHIYFKKWDFDQTNVFEKEGTPSDTTIQNFEKLRIYEYQGKWAIKALALLKYSDTEPSLSHFETKIVGIFDAYPKNDWICQPQPVCEITISSNKFVDILWYENSTGSWIFAQGNYSVKSGTYTWKYTQATEYNKTYWWKVKIVDVNTSEVLYENIYHFYIPPLLNNPTVWNWYLPINVSYAEPNTCLNFTIYNDGTTPTNWFHLQIHPYSLYFPDDIRFVTSSNLSSALLLPQWYEEIDTDYVTIVVRLPYPAPQKIYLLTGSHTMVSRYNDFRTLSFYDDFSEDTLNTSKWDNSTVGGYSIEDGVLKMWGNWDNRGLKTNKTFSLVDRSQVYTKIVMKAKNTQSGWDSDLAINYNNYFFHNYGFIWDVSGSNKLQILYKGTKYTMADRGIDTTWRNVYCWLYHYGMGIYSDWGSGSLIGRIPYNKGWFALAGDTDRGDDWVYVDWITIYDVDFTLVTYEDYHFIGTITFTNPHPANNSENITIQPVCSIEISNDGDWEMVIEFQENSTGSWVTRKTETGGNGYYSFTYLEADRFDTTYWWRVKVSIGYSTHYSTYLFTTQVVYFNILFPSYLEVGDYIMATGTIKNASGDPLDRLWATTYVIDSNDYVVISPQEWYCVEGQYEYIASTTTLKPGIYSIVVEFTDPLVNETYTFNHTLYLSYPASGGVYSDAIVYFHFYNTNEGLGLPKETLKIYVDGQRLYGDIYYTYMGHTINLVIKDYFNTTLYQADIPINITRKFIDIGLTFHSYKFNNMNNVYYMVSLRKEGSTRWFERGLCPYETIEFLLPTANYTIRIYDANYTELANFTTFINRSKIYLIQGQNISEVLSGQFGVVINKILELRGEVSELFRPSIVKVSYNEPYVYASYHSTYDNPQLDTVYVCPALVVAATSEQTLTTNTTSHPPVPTSSTDNGTIVILDDKLYFEGNPSTSVVVTNIDTNQELLNTTYLPSFLTLNGDNVSINTSSPITVKRVVKFQQYKKFYWLKTLSTGQYEATINITNPTSYDWREVIVMIQLANDSTPQLNTVKVYDVENGIWLEEGLNYEVSGMFIKFWIPRLNSTSSRHFKCVYYGSTEDIVEEGMPIKEVTSYKIKQFNNKLYYYFELEWINPNAVSYKGALHAKLNFETPSPIDPSSWRIIDVDNGRELESSEFVYSPGSLMISEEAVGVIPPGTSRTFDCYFYLEEPTTQPSEEKSWWSKKIFEFYGIEFSGLSALLLFLLIAAIVLALHDPDRYSWTVPITLLLFLLSIYFTGL